MSGILTQDSISLTESLDGVSYLVIPSSRKAGTIGHKNTEDLNKRAKSYLLSSVETDTRGGARHTDVPRRKRGWSNSASGHCHWTLYTWRRQESEGQSFRFP